MDQDGSRPYSRAVALLLEPSGHPNFDLDDPG